MSRLNRRLTKRERGIALLMVLGMLALVGSVVADLQYNSNVDLRLALNAMDEVQAEYNALSALRLRAILLKNSAKLQRAMQGPLQGLLGEGVQLPFAQILDTIPVECGIMSAITRASESPFAELSPEDEGDAEEKGDEEEDTALGDFFQGECLATSTSEHSKISINMFAARSSGKEAQAMLLGMLLPEKMERHFEEDDRNGVHAESPAELVGAIADWIDADDNQEVNKISDEDRHYAYLEDAYQPKNAPFDSLAELQLVHGIDDELYAMLKDHVTIHANNNQIELSTAPMMRIFWGLLSCVREGILIDDMVVQRMFILLHEIEEHKAMSMGFMVLKVATLQSLARDLVPELDDRLISQRFTDKTSTTWYTIEAQGRLRNASRRIRAVFQAEEGQFYHVRIE